MMQAFDRLIQMARSNSPIIYNKELVVPVNMNKPVYCKVFVGVNREVYVQFFSVNILSKIVNENFRIPTIKSEPVFQPFPQKVPDLFFYNQPPIDNDLERFTIAFLSLAAESLHKRPRKTVKIRNALHTLLKVDHPILVFDELHIVVSVDKSYVKVISPYDEFKTQQYSVSDPPTTGAKGKELSEVLNEALHSIEMMHTNRIKALISRKTEQTKQLLKSSELRNRDRFQRLIQKNRDKINISQMEEFKMTEARVNLEEEQLRTPAK